jgi:Membrane protein involved in the export of O-antigen and teichoic acid
MEIKKSILINASGKYSKVFLALIMNAILARMLSPEDFGIVAVITVFSTFFTTLSDMGFGPAIIQNKELTEEDISNIYSFTVYAAIVLMLVFILCAYPIAAFYGDSVYISLGRLLSISLLFNALNMVPNGILNRDKKFRSIAIRTVVVFVGAAVFTILLAFLGLGYYALAIQAIMTSLFSFVWNYATTRPKFRLRFNLESIKKVMNYSAYQFAFNLVNYFSKNLDNLLIGKFMGSAELGYYSKAYTLMLFPVNNLTGVISPVLHPILSDYQKQLDVIYDKYMKIVHLLACIGLYVAPICFLGANEIITIIYGKNWGESVICFQFLSIAIIPQMINSSSGSIFQAIGNTRQLFTNGLINT